MQIITSKASRSPLSQLEAELRIARKKLVEEQQRLKARRQQIASEHSPEMLALLDGDPISKVFVTTVVEKLVFRDEQGNVISQSDGVPIGQIVEVKLVEPSPDGNEGQDHDSE